MAGLALKLAPKEQVLINGVIVENGPRRAQLLIKTDNAAILRLRDALDQADVIGPASEAYFIAQSCVAGQMAVDDAKAALTPIFPKLEASDRFDSPKESIESAKRSLAAGNLYRVMRALRPMVDAERLCNAG